MKWNGKFSLLTSLASLIVWDSNRNCMAFVNIGHIICGIWPIMYSKFYIEGGMLDIKNYQVIIISYQLREMSAFYMEMIYDRSHCPSLPPMPPVPLLPCFPRCQPDPGPTPAQPLLSLPSLRPLAEVEMRDVEVLGWGEVAWNVSLAHYLVMFFKELKV